MQQPSTAQPAGGTIAGDTATPADSTLAPGADAAGAAPGTDPAAMTTPAADTTPAPGNAPAEPPANMMQGMDTGAAGSTGQAMTEGTTAAEQDPALTQCLADLTAAGTTVGACEMCLCGACQPELAAVAADAAADALVACQTATNCVDTCCLCGTGCDSAGSNFGDGPCSDETQTAAGVAPMSGLLGGIANGATVTENCAADGPDPANACTKALKLGACSDTNCAAECDSGATCAPFM